MEFATRIPDADLAAAIAARVVGRAPTSVRRFTTGARHYVFDVSFAEGAPIVVRIADASGRAELIGALHLSELLRPRGVRLPAIVSDDVQAEFPWMAIERLPGVDLGDVIADLPNQQLSQIAGEVAHAQSIVARTHSAGRYGYASLPERAPHQTWSGVLTDNLSRSRARIAQAGLFDPGLVDVVEAEFALMGAEIDRVAPTPFLHDTTTRNVIIAPNGEFSGIVDVDDLCFGDPRYPAALTLAVLLASDGPVDYVSSWMRQAGQRDDRLFQLYVALFLLDLMSEHGQIFNGNQSPSTAEPRARLLRVFERRLAGIG
jgi:aminoglycoside phosphotransferase